MRKAIILINLPSAGGAGAGSAAGAGAKNKQIIIYNDAFIMVS